MNSSVDFEDSFRVSSFKIPHFKSTKTERKFSTVDRERCGSKVGGNKREEEERSVGFVWFSLCVFSGGSDSFLLFLRFPSLNGRDELSGTSPNDDLLGRETTTLSGTEGSSSSSEVSEKANADGKREGEGGEGAGGETGSISVRAGPRVLSVRASENLCLALVVMSIEVAFVGSLR